MGELDRCVEKRGKFHTMVKVKPYKRFGFLKDKQNQYKISPTEIEGGGLKFLLDNISPCQSKA